MNLYNITKGNVLFHGIIRQQRTQYSSMKSIDALAVLSYLEVLVDAKPGSSRKPLSELHWHQVNAVQQRQNEKKPTEPFGSAD